MDVIPLAKLNVASTDTMQLPASLSLCVGVIDGASVLSVATLANHSVSVTHER